MSEELDRRVAIEVMGEPEPEPAKEIDVWGNLVYSDGGPIPVHNKSKGGNWRIARIYGRGDKPEWKPLPFSTFPDHAMRAVRHVLNEHKAEGALLRIEHEPLRDEPAWFVNLNWPHPAKFARGQTPPEAICNLLLTLKEGEGKG